MSKITRIDFKPVVKQKKKVAAYARVSVETERMNHSLVAQVSHYQNFIQSNPHWEYAGVFADDGISGTGIKKRAGFQEMIESATRGEIDIILTKSIQRFARNTVDLLNTVRFLKSINVEVVFEKENISTLSADGELMLSILASFAQEESRSISENIKWSIRKRMEQGCITNRNKTIGYEWKDGNCIIVPEEADVVRRIFNDFLNGKKREEIKRELNAEGITTSCGNVWKHDTVTYVLSNPTYRGDSLLQKVYTVDPISKHKVRNKGELPQYYVEETHEPIIDKDTFDKVQEKLKVEQDLIRDTGVSRKATPFSGKVKCGECGMSFHRVKKEKLKYGKTVTELRWHCRSSRTGKISCNCGTIMEDDLYKETATVLGLEEFDEEIFKERIDYMSIPSRGRIDFHFKDGSIIERSYKSRKRPNHWEHNVKYKGASCFTSLIKCPYCGSKYKSSTNTCRSGKKIKSWFCITRCQGFQIRDEDLRAMCSEVLDFNDETFRELVEKVEILSKKELIIYMKNGERRYYGKGNEDTCKG